MKESNYPGAAWGEDRGCRDTCDRRGAGQARVSFAAVLRGRRASAEGVGKSRQHGQRWALEGQCCILTWAGCAEREQGPGWEVLVRAFEGRKGSNRPEGRNETSPPLMRVTRSSCGNERIITLDCLVRLPIRPVDKSVALWTLSYLEGVPVAQVAKATLCLVLLEGLSLALALWSGWEVKGGLVMHPELRAITCLWAVFLFEMQGQQEILALHSSESSSGGQQMGNATTRRQMNEVGCGQQDTNHSEQNDLQGYSGISRDAALR